MTSKSCIARSSSAAHRTSGATGSLTAVEALTQLLTGTGLTYKYLDDKTITILACRDGGHVRTMTAFRLPRLRPAQAEPQSAALASTSAPTMKSPLRIQEVQITGSRLVMDSGFQASRPR